MRAVKFVIVLAGLMMGFPAIASAHAGRDHGTPDFTRIGGSSFAKIVVTDAVVFAPKKFLSLTLANIHRFYRPVFELSSSSGESTSACTPGSCCCQGASSCSSGHCSFGMTASQNFVANACAFLHLRLARLGWPYPDLIFGFDRPPKV